MALGQTLRSFRLVCDWERIAAVEQLLRAEGYEMEAEPFSPLCRRLITEPRPLGSSLAAFFGYIYIQDRSSMLPPLALNPPQGAAILDLCASPGSKSGFLAQLAGRNGFVLANEPNPSRLATLRANLQKANLVQAGSCGYAGEKIPLPHDSFNYILLDPPCSGWGTVEKNPSVLRLWQGKKLKSLTDLQKALLRRAATLLKPGGSLLYSTCTTNRDENEAQTIFAEKELGLQRVELPPFPGFTFTERPGGEGCLLVDGTASQAQGFYLSLLSKPGHPGPAKPGHPVLRPQLDPGAWPEAVWDANLLPDGEICVFGQRAYFLPEAAITCLPANFAWQGFLLGRIRVAGGRPVLAANPGLRFLLRPDVPRLVFDEPAQIRALLNGQEVRQDGMEGLAALYWRDLPLGLATIRGGRVIAKFGT